MHVKDEYFFTRSDYYTKKEFSPNKRLYECSLFIDNFMYTFAMLVQHVYSV